MIPKPQQTAIRATFVLSPNAKDLTPEIAIRTFFGKSEADFIKELQLCGNSGIDRLLENKKAGKRAAATV